MKIEPPSRSSGLHREERAARVQPEGRVEVLLGDLAEFARLARPGAGPQHVDGAVFPLDRLEQAVEIVQVGRISLHGSDIPADQLDAFIQRFLPPARDEDVSSLAGEQLGAGQRHTA
jgi:hypothetical protein